jgi:hypothetical protein
MTPEWQPDPVASFARRMGPPQCDDLITCPDVWELDNGDVAVIGRDLTVDYVQRLPVGVNMGDGERLVVIPGDLFRAAKAAAPDA